MDIRPKQIGALGMKMGRPRHLDTIGGLGLVLVWYRTRGPCNRTLTLMFGQTLTPYYKW